VENNTYLRISIFIGTLLIMAGLELFFPRRNLTQPKSQRWATNLSLVLIDSLFLRLLGPISAFAAAEFAMHNNWGILSKFPLPYYLDIILGIILLDLAIYWQHVLSHKIPLLWRLHRVHHADRDIDVTTGIRFHPIEIILSVFYKCIIIFILGPVTLAVILFEIILNTSALFNHANIALPKTFDKILRSILVTPDMHRVHHSTIPQETNSNYGFCLSFWDKLFNTYNAQPKLEHNTMQIGLTQYQSEKPNLLSWCLMLPFNNHADYSEVNHEITKKT
jgi:sterol desaturase/sphingolipid hydroxylase (fatty acid hydroxylase superfamily)